MPSKNCHCKNLCYSAAGAYNQSYVQIVQRPQWTKPEITDVNKSKKGKNNVTQYFFLFFF